MMAVMMLLKLCLVLFFLCVCLSELQLHCCGNHLDFFDYILLAPLFLVSNSSSVAASICASPGVYVIVWASTAEDFTAACSKPPILIWACPHKTNLLYHL